MATVAAWGGLFSGVPVEGSPYYRLDVVARSGATMADGGGVIDSIEPNVSVNERGDVAFIAVVDGAENLVVAQSGGGLVNVSGSPAGRNFDFPQINNHGRVVTRELLAGNSLVRLWNLANTGAGQVIASSTFSPFTQLTLPTVGDTGAITEQPLVGFLGRVGDLPFAWFANDRGERDVQDSVSALTGTRLATFRAASAASSVRRFVALYEGIDGARRLGGFEFDETFGLWDQVVFASTAASGEWLALGSTPGISASGKLAAFAGDHVGDGPGIHLVQADRGFRGGVRVFPAILDGRTIAYDAEARPVTLGGILDPPGDDARISVIHVEAGEPGLEGDWAVVVFRATPSGPYLPDGVAAPALWTLRIDFERQLEFPWQVEAHPRSPVPVVFEGEVIPDPSGPAVPVGSVSTWDPLAVAVADADGRPRLPTRGDHHLAFATATDDGIVVVRASRLDTDGDGLTDDWETRGVPVPGAAARLDLAALGADPMRRDVFLEIDWLPPRLENGAERWTNEPAPGMTEKLAAMFAGAPVANPDGTTGITLHVDAGPGFDRTLRPLSQNMGPNPNRLDGGDFVAMPGRPDRRADLVHVAVPGSLEAGELGFLTLHEAKMEAFAQGSPAARGREYAFKYALMADFQAAVLNRGQTVFETRVTANSAEPAAFFIESNLGEDNRFRRFWTFVSRGAGAGQFRRLVGNGNNWIRVDRPFDPQVDASSHLILVRSVTGRGEVHFEDGPGLHAHPGNDTLITMATYGPNEGGWLANAQLQWRNVAHEIGHTLSLRHGGTDHEAFKGDAYRSLMSYSWIWESGSDVQSFSDRFDPTFDDWAHVEFDFPETTHLLGNAFGLKPGGNSIFEDFEEPGDERFEEIHGGPADLTPPRVAIVSPAEGASVPSGGLTVTATATDETDIAGVVVYVDLDGDGEWRAEDGEVVPAVFGGNDSWVASFQGVAGAFGARRVLVVASDTSANDAAAHVTIFAGSGAGGGTVLGEPSGSFSAQGAGGSRREVLLGPWNLPSPGVVTFTVTADPSVRTGDTTGEAFDAEVTVVDSGGESFALAPVCTAAGRTPATCTSTFLARTPGPLSALLEGPARYDAAGAFLATPAQSYAVTVTFRAVDLAPPAIVPGATGAFFELGEPAALVAEVTDDVGPLAVEVAFDVNGDGDAADPGETVSAAPVAGDGWEASFPVLSGGPGPRTARWRAVDGRGRVTEVATFVEVRAPDVVPPDVTIEEPAPGQPFEGGAAVSVAARATDDVELAGIEAAFDVDGNGSIDGDAGEILAMVKTGENRFEVGFAGLSGPNGARTIVVTTVDTAGNEASSSVPITVGGVEPVVETIFTDDEGFISAQSSVWSGGSQQVVPYDPIAIPGSGTVTFTVTATPPVRQEVQNITRADPYVRDIVFAGESIRLAPACNPFGSDPSVCTTTFEAEGAGLLDFAVLGPGTWNIWGEFSGHAEQTYTLEVTFAAVDQDAPEIVFVTPVRGDDLPLGSPVTVRASVADDAEPASVVIRFDVNGDGDAADAGEAVAASAAGGGVFEAGFAALSGAAGSRTIEVAATDPSFNTGRRSITVGVGGVGAGESEVFAADGIIPAQPNVFQGGSRQSVPFTGIAIPGPGRITFTVESTPPVRRALTNLERHDAMVSGLVFNGQPASLAPDCNPPGSDPAVCVSTWDTPGAGTLDFTILGPAEFNIWGEFQAHPEIEYHVEVLFRPGPVVASVAPSSGSTGGGDLVVITGSGFGVKPVVLFDGVPARQVTRTSAGRLECLTPPGVAGPVELTVVNEDPEGEPWNYGIPYGLFGTRGNGFTYQVPPAPAPLEAEQLVGTWHGVFEAVGSEEAQRRLTVPVAAPGAGRLRFEAHAFIPILNPIPGPFEAPDDLSWHNESTAVQTFRGPDGVTRWMDPDCSDLAFPYGAVICESLSRFGAAAAGSGEITLRGPARWNAFWRQFGEFVMISAPTQTWSVAAWFADQPGLSSVSPASGTGGTLLTVQGTHFAEGLRVFVGGVEAEDVRLASASRLTCRVPAVDAGLLDVRVELLGMDATLPAAFRHDGGGGPSEDADGDGLVTLVERFMGLDPATHDSDGALAVERSDGRVALVYRRARETGGLTGWVEWSPDLLTWSRQPVVETVVHDDPGDLFVLVSASISVDAAEPRFLRLRVLE